LDADEEADAELIGELTGCYATASRFQARISRMVSDQGRASQASGSLDISKGRAVGFSIHRKNFFLGRWIEHGGFWPDPKLRLFHRGYGRVDERSCTKRFKPAVELSALSAVLSSTILPHTLRLHRPHEPILVARCGDGRSQWTSQLQCHRHPPTAGTTFTYNYCFRLGFLDGREGCCCTSTMRLRLLEIRQGVGNSRVARRRSDRRVDRPSVAQDRVSACPGPRSPYHQRTEVA